MQRDFPRKKKTGKRKTDRRSARRADIRGNFFLMLAAVLLLAFSLERNTPAVYADRIDSSRKVSLSVVPVSKDFQDDLDEKDIIYDLYAVAGLSEETAGSLSFSMKEAYKEMSVTGKETAEGWQEKAQEAFLAAVSSDKPVISGRSLADSEKMEADDDGKALTPGLYLLIARGADPSLEDPEAYIFSREQDGKTIKGTKAVSGEYIYEFLPALILLPYTDPEITGEVRSSDDGEWEYDVTVHLKPSREDRYGDIKIIKKLLNYKEGTDAEFVFLVIGTLNGQENYRKEVTLSYGSGSGAIRETVLTGIPVGTYIDVTELEAEGYVLVQEDIEEHIVRSDETIVFAFANDYTEPSSSEPTPEQTTPEEPTPEEPTPEETTPEEPTPEETTPEATEPSSPEKTTPEETTPEETTPKETEPDTPDTGDRSGFRFYVILASSSGILLLAAAAAGIIKKKKKKHQ